MGEKIASSIDRPFNRNLETFFILFEERPVPLLILFIIPGSK